jgi:hypothetical protein
VGFPLQHHLVRFRPFTFGGRLRPKGWDSSRKARSSGTIQVFLAGAIARQVRVDPDRARICRRGVEGTGGFFSLPVTI